MLTEVLPDGTAFDMILVEGGSFQMGSEDEDAYDDEKPVHEVVLDGFYIGKFPVTQSLWKAVMKDNPSFFNGDSRPVERVSWEDTQKFIQKLDGLTGKTYRLPTEAEWEYAARGGRQSKGYKYAGSNKLKEVGWYWENTHFETKAVGLKYPNELGLYDISGNVREWCGDWFDENYYEECHKQGIVENPQGPAEGLSRVLRACPPEPRAKAGRRLEQRAQGLPLFVPPLLPAGVPRRRYRFSVGVALAVHPVK